MYLVLQLRPAGDVDFTDGLDGGIHTVLGIDASAGAANGVWRLRVAGGPEYSSGYLDSWSLQF